MGLSMAPFLQDYVRKKREHSVSTCMDEFIVEFVAKD